MLRPADADKVYFRRLTLYRGCCITLAMPPVGRYPLAKDPVAISEGLAVSCCCTLSAWAKIFDMEAMDSSNAYVQKINALLRAKRKKLNRIHRLEELRDAKVRDRPVAARIWSQIHVFKRF